MVLQKNKEVSGDCKLCDLERRAIKEHYIRPDRQSEGEGGVWRRARSAGKRAAASQETSGRDKTHPLFCATSRPRFFPKCQPEWGPGMGGPESWEGTGALAGVKPRASGVTWS